MTKKIIQNKRRIEGNWNIVVSFHDCPMHYVDEGDRFCAHENGRSQYCQQEGCPLIATEKRELDVKCIQNHPQK
jgi:protoheme ferro-lyase